MSWRKLGAAVYNYVDRRTNKAMSRTQRYNTSAMNQMMERIAVSEEQWCDTESVFARPERLRLKLQMRSSKLKCELADDVSLETAATMLEALRSQQ